LARYQFNINRALKLAGALSLMLVATLALSGPATDGSPPRVGRPMTLARQRRVVDLAVTAIVAVCVSLLPTHRRAPSFSAAHFISFPPVGFSLRWYGLFMSSRRGAARRRTFMVGRTPLATVLGTMASIGVMRLRRPPRR
jgi:hypothetical protein